MKSDYKQTFVCRFQCFKELSRFCRSVGLAPCLSVPLECRQRSATSATYIGKPRAKLSKYLKIK